ncbi:MAG: hypothetical protein WA061_02360 [Microgenomates group bacterium]
MSKKIRKFIGKICPDCEEAKLQENSGLAVCPKCGYEQSDDAQKELDIQEQRRLKNEESEVREERKRTTSNSTNRVK